MLYIGVHGYWRARLPKLAESFQHPRFCQQMVGEGMSHPPQTALPLSRPEMPSNCPSDLRFYRHKSCIQYCLLQWSAGSLARWRCAQQPQSCGPGRLFDLHGGPPSRSQVRFAILKRKASAQVLQFCHLTDTYCLRISPSKDWQIDYTNSYALIGPVAYK